MKKLFENEIREAENKLQKKGYYVTNMRDCHNDKFELYNGDCEIVMDYLSVAQLLQLAELL